MSISGAQPGPDENFGFISRDTNAERQRDYRARKASQHATEVRGIFAHADDHAELKAHAAKMAKKRAILTKKRLASGVL